MEHKFFDFTSRLNPHLRGLWCQVSYDIQLTLLKVDNSVETYGNLRKQKSFFLRFKHEE